MSLFRPGQPVICIDASSSRWCGWGPTERLIWGRRYTIERAFAWFDGTPVVWLKELQRDELARRWFGDNVGYASRRFRPITEHKTDISIFEKIARDVTERAPVDHLVDHIDQQTAILKQMAEHDLFNL